jgi:hypothetical protein
MKEHSAEGIAQSGNKDCRIQDIFALKGLYYNRTGQRPVYTKIIHLIEPCKDGIKVK